MKLLVVSYKSCWTSKSSPTAFATDGGFPLQMNALSELFDETRLALPLENRASREGEVPIFGHNLSVIPLPAPRGRGLKRKLFFPLWFLRSARILWRESTRADAVHAPIPGDVGTIGMLLACLMGKPLLVRHCGNWFVQTTAAEHFWKWFMERFAGGQRVMLATGGAKESPSRRNPNVYWIFSTSMNRCELQAAAKRHKKTQPGARLIIACRQEKEKGTGVVIQSLPLILRRFPHALLDVVGDGSALERFKQLAEALGVSDCVSFHGKLHHDAVIDLLKEADVFCYPTTSSEGFPKAVLEALAHGLPVVTTNVSVLPELIGRGCGRLIEQAGPAEVAEAVIEILSDRECFCQMSERAIDIAGQYSLEHWRDTIGELLRAAWDRPLRTHV